MNAFDSQDRDNAPPRHISLSNRLKLVLPCFTTSPVLTDRLCLYRLIFLRIFNKKKNINHKGVGLSNLEISSMNPLTPQNIFRSKLKKLLGKSHYYRKTTAGSPKGTKRKTLYPGQGRSIRADHC
jgi:hypothetical protein